jgi:chemotaxis protein CheZ
MTSAEKITADGAHRYLDRVIHELRGMRSEGKHPLVNILEYLSDHIRHTRAELGALKPGVKDASMLSSTADELEEIVAETARAANEIMGAAEAIEALAANVDRQLAEAMLIAVTRIYEASAFQDITGQRITKIVRALQHIESKLQTLVDECAGDDGAVESEPKVTGDAALLNGPQLGKNANSQSEIDLLFGAADGHVGAGN